MYDWISSGFPLVCAVVGLIVYKKMWLNSKKALFPKLISLGVGCIALGSLYDVSYLLVRNMQTNGIYIGFLGIIGCFLFLLSANYGQLDRLFDDGSKVFSKHRILAGLAPVVVIGLFLPIFFSEALPVSMRIFAFLGWLPVVFASYYNLKHALLPDCGFVFVKAVRPYNVTAVILEVSYTAHLVMRTYGLTLGVLMSAVVIGVALIGLLHFAKKGVSRWTI